MDRQPRRAPLGKAGGEVVSAAGVGNRNRAWLSVILLHVTALAFTFETWIEIFVARAVGIGAVGPFGVGALNWKPAHPFPQRVLYRECVGHVVTGRAHFSA